MTERSPLYSLSRPPTQQPTTAIASTKNESPTPTKPFYKSTIKLKAGSLELSNLKGDFLEVPWVRLSEELYSKAEIIINDPDDKLRPQIESAGKIELEFGFVFPGGDWKHCVFMGDLDEVGRRLPNATIVIALDPSFSLSSSIGSSVQSGMDASASTKNGGIKSSGNNIDLLLAPMDALNSSTSTPAESFTKNHPNLKFAANTSNRLAGGSIRVGQSEQVQASNRALLQGDALIARGNTVRQVAPSSGEDSGVVLDYYKDTSAFIGHPRFTKKKGQSGGGGGSVTVEGWNATEKRKITATVVSPAKPKQSASSVLQTPTGEQINLTQPIFAGSQFTWNDVTAGGTRAPDKPAMAEAEKLARAIASIGDKIGAKPEVVSWFRDKATVARQAKGGGQGVHATGGAVDLKIPLMDAVYRYLNETWPGGLGLNPGHYIHLDIGKEAKRFFY